MRKLVCLCFVLAALAVSTTVNAQQMGRCCYLDPAGNLTCTETTQTGCAGLSGQWTAGLTCAVPCDSHCVNCAPGDMVEDEPCPSLPDTFNAGCYGQPPRFTPIQCQTSYCGRAWATPGGTVPPYVDHDAFVFTLTESTFVSICLKAEYAVLVELFQVTTAAPCPGIFVARDQKDSCQFACIERCLPPGTYTYYTQPVAGQTIDCLPYRLVMHCRPCDTSCVVCLPNDLRENEPCPAFPDTVNGGCNATPPRFSPIECDHAVCGQSWSSGGAGVPSFFDVDAYIITLPTRTFVTLCLIAEYQAVLEIQSTPAAAPCPSTTLEIATVDSCDTLCIRRCLEPGTYIFQTYPVAGQNFECRDYRLALRCDTCPEPCVVECPPNAYPENELCPPHPPGDPNGGCLSSPHLFQYIECGMTICGTSWLVQEAGAPALFDADAYTVFVSDTTRLRFCVVAEFAAGIGLVSHDDSCLTFSVLDTAFGLACDTICVDTCVPPGSYDFYVLPVPGLNDPFLCHTYVAHLSCEPCTLACQPTRVVLFDTPQVPQCECVHLSPGATVPILVCGPAMHPGRPPILTVTPGCFVPDLGVDHCNEPCDPIPSTAFFYSNAGWTWNDSLHCWRNYIIGYACGCACVCLDGFLAVELQSFSALEGDGSVTLNWQTASESETDHFELLRDGHAVASHVPATNSPSGARYNWTDRDLQNGRTYTYELVAVDLGGIRTTLASTEATPAGGTAEVISEYALRQNYPNPFNPITSISFDLVESGRVTLKVFNTVGQAVATVVSGEMNAGRHTVTFDASALPSGMYLYRLEAGRFSATKKMLLMK